MADQGLSFEGGKKLQGSGQISLLQIEDRERQEISMYTFTFVGCTAAWDVHPAQSLQPRCPRLYSAKLPPFLSYETLLS